MIFLLFPYQASSEIMQTRFIVIVPFLKFGNGCLEVDDQLVDLKVIAHHLFMKDSALIWIFGLNKQWQLSVERPRLKVCRLCTTVEGHMITEEYSVFDELFLRPLVSLSRNGHFFTKAVGNFKRAWTDDFHLANNYSISQEKFDNHLMVSSDFFINCRQRVSNTCKKMILRVKSPKNMVLILKYSRILGTWMWKMPINRYKDVNYNKKRRVNVN